MFSKSCDPPSRVFLTRLNNEFPIIETFNAYIHNCNWQTPRCIRPSLFCQTHRKTSPLGIQQAFVNLPRVAERSRPTHQRNGLLQERCQASFQTPVVLQCLVIITKHTINLLCFENFPCFEFFNLILSALPSGTQPAASPER